MKLSIVILAAGQGTRMRSSLPKVLHPLAGRPLLQHVLDTAQALDPEAIYVVYGHGGKLVPSQFLDRAVHWVEQARQMGTGHAVGQALPLIPDDHAVLILYGDVPLIRTETLAPLIKAARSGSLGLLTVDLSDPKGYGRIVRDGEGRVECIVEHKDANDRQLEIREGNTGILAVSAGLLGSWLSRLENQNAQGEFYLTDVIAMAVAGDLIIHTHQPEDPEQVMGVNDRLQLAHLERYYQSHQAAALMANGVTLMDPSRLDIRGTVTVESDVLIDVDVILEGEVHIAGGVTIGPFTRIRDSEIGADSQIFAHCDIDGARVGEACRIGPFARLRPQAELAGHVHAGNFVEIKKSTVGEGSKVNHLSYIGDTTIGQSVNIGAGTITCNYDGANKHRTIIGDRAFIGSDTQLVAPVQVGEGATIGAGSTITRDTPAEALTLSKRNPQVSRADWKRPVKKV